MSLLTGHNKSQIGSYIVALHRNVPLPFFFFNTFSEADKVKSTVSRADTRSSGAGAPWRVTGEIWKRQHITQVFSEFSVCFTFKGSF